MFVLAGWVKGVVGMGLPTVVIGALGLAMAPVRAAALLVVPLLVANFWQFAAGPARWPIAQRLASMMICICPGTAVGIHFLTSGSSRWRIDPISLRRWFFVSMLLVGGYLVARGLGP